VVKERAVLFGALVDGDPRAKRAADGGAAAADEALDELEQLAGTAGAVVAGKACQRRHAVHRTTFVGSGFAEQLGRMAEDVRADVLISDDDLSPAQAWNLEKITGRRVVDRSELILDIFATRARTRQAKLQVELAQLEYALPRLKRLWGHLDREKGGIGLRGPGETQIETDRRIVKKKIQDLRHVLSEIQARKEREVAGRAGEFAASLVGYTNAGKSTLMNVLSGGTQYVEDKLFATLDTKTAVCEVRKGVKVLLSDTVGFIRKLPHHLVASFHATLEEASQADLLLHVVDVSHPDAQDQIEAVNGVLHELGIREKPTLVVFNKVDALSAPGELEYWRRLYPQSVAISARTGAGIDELEEKLVEIVGRTRKEEEIRLAAGAGRAIAFIHEKGEVVEEKYEDSEVVIRFRMGKKDLGTLKGLIAHQPGSQP
jgi:GTP-binding protein HflX